MSVTKVFNAAVSDSVSVGESVSAYIYVPPINISGVSESITVTDIAHYYEDSIVVSESVSVLVVVDVWTVNVSDTISVAENVNVALASLIAVTSAIIVGESVDVAVLGALPLGPHWKGMFRGLYKRVH